MFADEFKRTCNITIKPLRVTFGYTCPNVTEAVRLHSLLQPKKAFQPIGSSQFWGVPIFSPWHTNSSWRRKNKKAIKKLWPISCFFCFFLTIISFRCRFAKYLLVHLLPLLPIRILWKLHVVITVTIVTRVVGPLLQRLLGDGLGPPVLLVVGLAALGVRLVKHICLPFPADVTSAVALNSTGTAAPLWLEWDAPPSSTTPGTAEGQTSLGIATPATWWWSSPSSGWGRPPPAGTSATAPHAVHVIITIIRVFISSTVVVIVVTIVIVIVVFISIIVWRVSITPSTPTPSAPAWWGHTWRRVIIVIVIPGERRTALHSWNCAWEAKVERARACPQPTLCSWWSAELLGALSSSCLGVSPRRSQSPLLPPPSRSSHPLPDGAKNKWHQTGDEAHERHLERSPRSEGGKRKREAAPTLTAASLSSKWTNA